MEGRCLTGQSTQWAVVPMEGGGGGGGGGGYLNVGLWSGMFQIILKISFV